MNSVINRAINTGNGINYECSKPSRVQKLPSEYLYPGNDSVKSGQYSYQQKIKWRHSEQPSINNQPAEINLAKLRINSITNTQKYISRSNSTDLNNVAKKVFDKMNNSCSNVHFSDESTSKTKLSIASDKTSSTSRSRIGRIESGESIIEMHKFFKEKKIYSDPNDNYKRRTIVLVKNSHNQHNKSTSELNSFDFGFHLQSYGLINTTTQLTEFICFVDNVKDGSPAKQAGLNNGDVLLAIDSIPINEFNNLHEIMKHVRGKQELRLVIMCENICKKIQLQQRVESIKAKLKEKKLELERMNKKQETILLNANNKNNYKSNAFTSFTSPLSSSTSSSMTNSSISESHLFPASPPFNQLDASDVLSPEISLKENTNAFIKNSTPNDFKSSTILSPDSNISNQNDDLPVRENREIPSHYQIDAQEIIDNINSRQKSSSSPNGTARIQVDLNLDMSSPIIPTPSSSYSTCSSASTSSSDNSAHNSSVFTFNRTRQLAQKCIQQTSRIVRSASSSSMNLITNLKLNRSSRSRNSSMCSTMNETADMSDCKKSKKTLNKSYTGDVLKKTNSVFSIENSSLSNDVILDSSKKHNLPKASSMNNKKTRSASDKTDKSIAKLLTSQQSSSKNLKKPQMIKSSAIKSSNSQSNNRKSILSKFNNNTSTNNTDTSCLHTSIPNTKPLLTNSHSKFTILQNKPKNERCKSIQSYPTVSLDLLTLENQKNVNPSLHKSSINIFSEPFSPILSNQSSLLNEIIDSGIDMGIGPAVSPNNSTSPGNIYSDGRVAKVLSDGGYSNFMNNFSIKDITYSDNVPNNNSTKTKKQSIQSTKSVNDEFLITKL